MQIIEIIREILRINKEHDEIQRSKEKKELAIRRPSGSSSAKALHKKATPNHDKG